jgi:2-aminoadipate transaminase
MEFDKFFSAAGSRLKSSKIRELMKLAGDPEIISMGGGLPDAEHFPFEEIRKIIDSWDGVKRTAALQYGATGGYGPLVEQIAEYVSASGVQTHGQAILPTTGAQQAIQLLTRVFCDPGDTVLVELPTFIGAVAVFIGYGADPVGLLMDDQGLVPGELEEKITGLREQNRSPKFLYTNPTFQNPTGITMSQSRRDEIYSLCSRYDVPIIEDDPYYELYFEGGPEDYRSLKARDKDDRVIRIGTFSKILSPGLRLGWILGPPDVVSRCELAKQSEDACSSSFSQVVAADYLAAGYVNQYTAKMRPIYSSKCRLMLDCLQKEMPEGVSWSHPAGGFFTWLTLPGHMDSEKLLLESIKHKVAFVTGSPFHVDGGGRNKLRLAFSNSSLEQIEEGVKRLAGAVRSML